MYSSSKYNAYCRSYSKNFSNSSWLWFKKFILWYLFIFTHLGIDKQLDTKLRKPLYSLCSYNISPISISVRQKINSILTANRSKDLLYIFLNHCLKDFLFYFQEIGLFILKESRISKYLQWIWILLLHLFGVPSHLPEIWTHILKFAFQISMAFSFLLIAFRQRIIILLL